jgi:hypothetical protein
MAAKQIRRGKNVKSGLSASVVGEASKLDQLVTSGCGWEI